VVRGGSLLAGDVAADRPIPVGSTDWWTWLSSPDARGFRFASAAGGFTARRERRRSGWYWYARRKVAGQVRTAYLGRGADLTVERLDAVLQQLNASAPTGRSSGAWTRPRGGLPGQITSFVGREREVGAVTELLRQARLLTVTGPGGGGKTRLAIEAAAAAAEGYRGGAWFVDLAPLGDPALVPRAVLAALGGGERPGQPVGDTLMARLQDDPLLLLLDNCEHLVGACADLVDALLRACPQLVVLATSREVLGVPGEVAWRVPPLSFPDPREPLQPDELLRYEAVRLFVERARLVDPSFALSGATVRPVAEICHRLDGMPLAIELAAARVAILTVEQVAARLGDRFRLLAGGSRTGVARHQTLRATVEWSHALLTPREQVLFRRLSVFAGGWTLEAAEAVCADRALPRDDVLEALAGLVAKSLVLPELGTARDAARPTRRASRRRYALLETLRQYGGERLVERDESGWLARRHARYCLSVAERAGTELTGPHQVAWFQRLEEEHDNMRAALGWAIRGGEAALALGLCGALYRFWWLHGHLDEGRAWTERALALSANASDARERLARAAALQGAGVLAGMVGDYAAARTLLLESAAIRRDLQEPWLTARALENAGMMATFAGDLAIARPELEQALALWRDVGDVWGTALATRDLGWLAHLSGDNQGARVLLEEGVIAFRSIGDWSSIGITRVLAVPVAIETGDFAAARAWAAEAWGAFRRLGDRWLVPWLLDELASLAAAEGHAERALRLAGAADAHRTSIGAVLPVVFAARRDRWLAAARARLTSAAAGAVWDQGQALSTEQSFAEGLAAPPPPERRAAAAGPLTEREEEVARLVARGLSSRNIAAALVIAERTAEAHVEHIRNKLGVRTRAQIAAWAVEHGLTRRGTPSPSA
jgi:predicted ATPase/DNA-binding CsgD family transcriptional regulator